MELDRLETNMIYAIDMSTAYEIEVIMKVYEQCRSFDKTIDVLRTANQHHISPKDAIERLGYNRITNKHILKL